MVGIDKRRAASIIAAVVVVAMGIVIVVLLVGRGDDSLAAPTPSPSPSATAPTSLPATEIYNAILPSLVVIHVENGGADGKRGEGLGTGVISNADGTILTAYHVVANAESIDVQFADGTTSQAMLAQADPANDIATLMPSTLPNPVVPAVLGGGVAVGSRVVAVGNPLGLVATTTEGVVSGLDRSATADDGLTLNGLIQFDAAVNPGSSGGPLLNERAQVVGIVTSLADPSDIGYFIGIGFAVPIGTAAGAGGEEPEK